MIRAILAIMLAVDLQAAFARSDIDVEVRRSAEMALALDREGIAGLFFEVQQKAWKSPRIPSAWSLANISKAERVPLDQAARQFGLSIAKKLDVESTKMRQLQPGIALYDNTLLLLAFSEWCAETEAYGNVLLAQRSLDLAAVGVARLSADSDFPLEKISGLTRRMSPAWMTVGSNVRILNLDAGAPIFSTPDRKEMERIYNSGRHLLKEKRDPDLRAERTKHPEHWSILATKEIVGRLEFFEDVSLKTRSISLVGAWEENQHFRFIVGLELKSVEKAIALFRFREAIGRFPSAPIYSEKQLREREGAVAVAAEQGLKIVSAEEAYGSPQRAAFILAWKQYIEGSAKGDGSPASTDTNLGCIAYQAYKEAIEGRFVDQETEGR